MPELNSDELADLITKRKPNKAIIIVTGNPRSGKSLYLCNVMNYLEEKYNIQEKVKITEWNAILDKNDIVMYESTDVKELHFIKYMAKKNKYDVYHVEMLPNYRGFINIELGG